MSDALDKAEAAARDAAANTDVVRIVAAVLAAQQATQQQPHQCQHHAPKQEFNAKKWLVIGGVGSVCALAFAVASIAIAIGACCATGCFLILRSIWQSTQKGN